MFVQVIQGRVGDPSGMRTQMDAWASELAPSATGWLGSTSGLTEDGTSVTVVRFDSEDAAQRNSQRPEQGEWWAKMAACYDGDPAFANCTHVDAKTYGDPADAGFVQVMQGRVSDVARARDLMGGDTIDWPAFRPDILGTLWAGSDDGDWTMAIYFTSEEAAREGEQKEPPPEAAALMAELNDLSVGEPRFFDLRDPWLMGPS